MDLIAAAGAGHKCMRLNCESISRTGKLGRPGEQPGKGRGATKSDIHDGAPGRRNFGSCIWMHIPDIRPGNTCAHLCVFLIGAIMDTVRDHAMGDHVVRALHSAT